MTLHRRVENDILTFHERTRPHGWSHVPGDRVDCFRSTIVQRIQGNQGFRLSGVDNSVPARPFNWEISYGPAAAGLRDGQSEIQSDTV